MTVRLTAKPACPSQGGWGRPAEEGLWGGRGEQDPRPQDPFPKWRLAGLDLRPVSFFEKAERSVSQYAVRSRAQQRPAFPSSLPPLQTTVQGLFLPRRAWAGALRVPDGPLWALLPECDPLKGSSPLGVPALGRGPGLACAAGGCCPVSRVGGAHLSRRPHCQLLERSRPQVLRVKCGWREAACPAPSQ